MRLSSDQVLALAPDAGSAANGKKLADVKYWRGVGQNERALWGECQGSALYQVRVDLTTFSVKCSCPSHKFPCKHGLGLLLLAVDDKSAPADDPPDWVREWLAKRAETAEKQPIQSNDPSKPVDAAARAKRAQKRAALVEQGLARLDLWLSDLVRNGLAALEAQPATLWERQAAQMVDAQAPGVAARLRQLAGVPGSSEDWPERLVGGLGQLALLTHAYSRLDALDAPLRHDVRQLIGWTLSQEELTATGEQVTDDWLALGQWIEDGEQVRTQRAWLLGVQTRRPALLLSFSARGAPFPQTLAPGLRQRATLTFYPGGAPLRARLDSSEGESTPVTEVTAGLDSIEAFLAGVAATLARQPWQDRFLCALRRATPVCLDDGNRWYLRDSQGVALPLIARNHWRLLALSGGYPVDVAGEWDGVALRPLGICSDGRYHPLCGDA
ncbi:MAG: SWIM zinc finger family protein [Ktedonobacterales bacterium]